ncbi:MAG: RIP metalloprotease RseP [Spirochaetaceae bacterium]|nr:MAG: RIP metalloprotease RseP [Spirochaetaceae bacterium]
MFLIILFGLLGLGLVVFVHEAGHLIAAKTLGVEVEAFSLGWGRPLASFSWRGTEYRLSMFPLGGYCKMKGEESFQKAVHERASEIPRDAGTFYGASVPRRIAILFAGPLANGIFAVLVLSAIWFTGFSFETFENRIILETDFPQAGSQTVSRADEAGMQTGDRIIVINGDPTPYFRDIQQIVAASADRELSLTVMRNGDERNLTVTPALDRQTGGGRLGIYPWIDPVIASVDGPAAVAGLQAGDIIREASGVEIPHSIAFSNRVQQAGSNLRVVYERGGERFETNIAPDTADTGRRTVGVVFASVSARTPGLGPIAALQKGTSEAAGVVVMTVRGLGTLFRGVDLTQAVAGPARIVFFTGEVASQGFQAGFGAGISSFFNFLSLLSVILGFMNLLPVPVFDGGQILINAYEGIRRKPLSAVTISRYQTVGAIIVLILIVFAVTTDILFFTGN